MPEDLQYYQDIVTSLRTDLLKEQSRSARLKQRLVDVRTYRERELEIIGSELMRLEAGLKREQTRIWQELEQHKKKAKVLEQENKKLREKLKGSSSVSNNKSHGSGSSSVSNNKNHSSASDKPPIQPKARATPRQKRVKSDSQLLDERDEDASQGVGSLQRNAKSNSDNKVHWSITEESPDETKKPQLPPPRLKNDANKSSSVQMLSTPNHVCHASVAPDDAPNHVCHASVASDDAFSSPKHVQQEGSIESFDHVVYIPSPSHSPGVEILWDFTPDLKSVVENHHFQPSPQKPSINRPPRKDQPGHNVASIKPFHTRIKSDDVSSVTRTKISDTLRPSLTEKRPSVYSLRQGPELQNASEKAQKLLGLLPGDMQEETMTTAPGPSEKAQKLLGLHPEQLQDDVFTPTGGDFSSPKSAKSSKPKDLVQFFKTMGSKKKRKDRYNSEPGIDANIVKMINKYDK